MHASNCFFFAAVAIVSSEASDIKLCAKISEKGVVSDLEGVSVSCFDEDSIPNIAPAPDEYMAGPVVTGADGCATLSYTKKATWDASLPIPLPGVSGPLPDIFCNGTKNNVYTVSK